MQKSIQKRIESSLQLVLPAGIKMQVGKEKDGFYTIKLSDQKLKLCWAENGWHSQIESAVAQNPDLVIAEKITPKAADILSNRKIGWVDETGAAEIAIGNIIVSRTGREVSAQKPVKNWSQSVIATAEVILSGHKATVEEIHKVSGYSWGACMNALRFLQEEGLLTSDTQRGRDSARQIKDKMKLLAAYTKAHTNKPPKAELTVGVIWKDPILGLEKLGKKLDANAIAWAATGMLASSVLAPIITDFGSYQIYVDATSMTGLELIAKKVNLKPLKGGRLTLIAYPKGMREITQNKNSIRVAPWPRVYADLIQTGVRGEEAAQHLAEVMNEK